ncbi:MAG: hypothetical protein JSU06_14610 [Actinobacteria bacterium]|nr:hypothetical protein [Actinomycetota bacterium]
MTEDGDSSEVVSGRLPGHEEAEISIAKLTDYALDPEHETGRHKARVFKSSLGFTRDHADELREKILGALQHAEAVSRPASKWGERWQVDVRIEGPNGNSRFITTSWMTNEGCSKLISAYIDPDLKANRDLEADDPK